MSKEQELQAQLEEARRALEQSKALNRNLADRLEEEKHRKIAVSNYDFVQMYRKEIKELRRLGQKDSLALNILLLFTEKMNKQNAIMISQGALMQITGMGRTRVNTAVGVLKKEKFVKVIKVGNANAYLINSGIFWRNSAKLKDKIAIFNASVIATGQEQDQEYLENWDNIELKQMPLLNSKETPIDEDGRIEDLGASSLSDFDFTDEEPINNHPDFALEQEIDGEETL